MQLGKACARLALVAGFVLSFACFVLSFACLKNVKNNASYADYSSVN